MRMPTLMRRDCTWSGTVGFRGWAYSSMFPDKAAEEVAEVVAGGAEDGTELVPEEVKKDLIEGWLEGWNWRLRTCAMVVFLVQSVM
jgi:hypothetical protein